MLLPRRKLTSPPVVPTQLQDMASEFSGMLKETLDRMRDRIELSNASGFDAEAGVPIHRQMEEFTQLSGGYAETKG